MIRLLLLNGLCYQYRLHKDYTRKCPSPLTRKKKKRFEKIKRKRKLWIPSPPFLALYKSCYTGCGLSLLLLPLLLLLWLVIEVQEWATGRRATPVRLKWPNGNVHTHTRSPPCSLFLYSVVCCVCVFILWIVVGDLTLLNEVISDHLSADQSRSEIVFWIWRAW